MDLNISSCTQTTRLASNYLNRSSICLSKLTHMDAIWSHVISISIWHRPTLCAIDDTSSMLLRLLSSVELSRSSYILLMFSHLICQNQCGLISHSIFLYLPIYLRKQLSINLKKREKKRKKPNLCPISLIKFASNCRMKSVPLWVYTKPAAWMCPSPVCLGCPGLLCTFPSVRRA